MSYQKIEDVQITNEDTPSTPSCLYCKDLVIKPLRDFNERNKHKWIIAKNYGGLQYILIDNQEVDVRTIACPMCGRKLPVIDE